MRFGDLLSEKGSPCWSTRVKLGTFTGLSITEPYFEAHPYGCTSGNGRPRTPPARTNNSDQWLFPGREPSRHIAAKSLTERLNRIGISCGARVAAFHDLASQIPSPVLADLIGYNPNFLAERANTLGTPWQTYATIRTQHTATTPTTQTAPTRAPAK